MCGPFFWPSCLQGAVATVRRAISERQEHARVATVTFDLLDISQPQRLADVLDWPVGLEQLHGQGRSQDTLSAHAVIESGRVQCHHHVPVQALMGNRLRALGGGRKQQWATD